MSITPQTPPSYNGDLRKWSDDLKAYLLNQDNAAIEVVELRHKTGALSAVRAGILMYDPTDDAPTFSDGTTWKNVATKALISDLLDELENEGVITSTNNSNIKSALGL